MPKMPTMPELPGSPTSVAKKITADWQWLNGLYASYATSTALRDNCVSARMRAEMVVNACRDMEANTNAAFTSLTTPPPALLAYKEPALNFRRKYKDIIIPVVAVLSMAPAVVAGPGKLEKVRVALRNLIFIGGGTSVLLYPEFVHKAVPALARTAEKAQRMSPKGSGV